MLVIGLTGGIGSGKSTVADLFAELGTPIIDADLIAREIVMPGESAYDTIVQHYGPEVLLPDNSLDRQQLRRIIFEHEHEREWLENTLHPIIRERIAQRLPLLQAPYCIVVIPLLTESTPFPFINRVLVVDTTLEQQKARISQRDQATAALIESMLESQASREERLGIADEVIVNDGVIADLVPQVEMLHRKYCSLDETRFFVSSGNKPDAPG